MFLGRVGAFREDYLSEESGRQRKYHVPSMLLEIGYDSLTQEVC